MTQHTFQVTTINFIYLNPGNFHDPTNILDCWFSRQSNSIGSPKTTPFDIRARYTEPHVVEFERKHKAIIDRFGRYPHRNAILERASSAEETAFLQEPDSAF